MKFDIDALKETLPVMGKGMLGIFIVIVLIYLTITIANAVTKPKKDKE
jgi:hypothetical protein